jgi:Dolichyl-phosphate-mannose-protein mannosyltransferase
MATEAAAAGGANRAGERFRRASVISFPVGKKGPESARHLLLLALTLLLVSLVVLRGVRRGEFDYNVDESQHAATGLYFADLLKNLPLAHAVHYTYLYYAQYPALSGVIHWPPFFYLCEGLLLTVFGPSVVAARITILLFALLAWFVWFRWVARIHNQWTAALSTVIFATLPAVLLFEKAVMLEIPSLALSIVSLYYWYEYLTTEEAGKLYRFAVFASLAMLTKQSSIFLVVACALSLIGLRRWKLLLAPDVLKALAIVAVLVGPFYTLVYLVHWKSIAMDLVGAPNPHPRNALLFYVRALPGQLGWPLLVLSLVGIATCKWWSKREASVVMLAWIAGCYITFTLISHKEARYSFYWIPAFTYFAVGVLTTPWRMKPARIVGVLLALALLASSLVSAWSYQRPYVAGYEALAQQVVERGQSGIILFDAELPANFIFFLHKFDPGRHFVVLRKSLWVMHIKRAGGEEELVHNDQQLLALMRGQGVKYVVVSDDPKTEFKIQNRLRSLLQSDPQFQLLGTFPIETNERDWQDRHLYLYQNLECAPPQDKFLNIRMLTLSHDIVVPWSELRQAWCAAGAVPSPPER